MTWTSSKDLAHLMDRARKQGWIIATTRNGHISWRSPSGETIFSGTTTHRRGCSLKNHLAMMKRAGFRA